MFFTVCSYIFIHILTVPLTVSLSQDISFLMPEFYSHVGYTDDHGLPLPPLDDPNEEVSFQSVAERSLSPDSAFDYISGSHRSTHSIHCIVRYVCLVKKQLYISEAHV